jgi:uncharacterized protein YjlB
MANTEFTPDPDLPFASSLTKPEILAIKLDDDGSIPNNALPLIVYRQAFDSTALRRESAALVQAIFCANNWVGAWVNGVFSYHHYHSTAHEVLGCFGGSATIQFGGPNGTTQTVNSGDVVVIPAGVAHKNCGSSADFGVVGAYPPGQNTDLLSGKASERPRADENIARVPLPVTDPVFGTNGPLLQEWRG